MQSVPRSNISFPHHRYIRDGERCFRGGHFEKALSCFTDFLALNPAGEVLVSGRISLTLMKLKRFKEAMKFLKSSIQSATHKERDYLWLYAECLYASGYVKESENLCQDICKRYPEITPDAQNLYRKVSIRPHLEVLSTPQNGSEEMEQSRLKAFEEIIKILVLQREYEEAYQYARNLMNNPRNTSTLPYLFMADYYLRLKSPAACDAMLSQLESSGIPEESRQKAFKYILAIYKSSPEFKFSKYKSKNPLAQLFKGMFKKTNRAIRIFNNQYKPVLNLDYYFDREPEPAVG